ncbi:MAG: Universal stress protein family protein [Deltaproteobacteria bacterium ADurb.Bin151]|nr:MAG: Universal stress protein family protein [Deltaproteobacteria bacterium ADurb.Bin151]
MNTYKNILYAINLNDENITSIIYALEFARLFNSRIHIVYVNDPQAGYRHPTDREDAVALRVRETVSESLLENLDVVYAVSKGNTAEEIVRYAQEHQIDLIMVGHKHRGKLYSTLFDSDDVNIINTAQLPVLVIPEK